MKFKVREKTISLLASIVHSLYYRSIHINLQKKIFQNPNIYAHTSLQIEDYFSIELPAENFKIIINENIRFKKYCHILLFPNAQLTIEKNVFFNNYCSINCLERIDIGENTIFGEGVKIYDHNHAYSYDKDHKLNISIADHITSPIIIGTNCWIASNVTILKGVTIGDNVIIGANNLIYQSIPANSIIKAKAENIIVNPQE